MTVAIIALLTAVGAVSYAGVTKKSRDSRRMSDLEKYRVALEIARQVGATYPTSPDTVLVNMRLLPAALTDPKAGYSYYYHKMTDYSYELYAQLEDFGSTNTSLSGHCGGVCNYRVTNP